jgi:alpha-amylase
VRRPIPLAPLALACLLALGACGPATPTPSGSASSSASAASPSASASSAAGSACTPATSPDGHDWNDRTWYEVFVRSFADSDGDGIGDLRGLTSKLDYLNDGDPATTDDLGIGGLWLMPIAEAASYHGYDVTDYEAVERDYGTREDLDALIAAAHERGIKVIVDLVLNHSSVDHPWFTASAASEGDKRDWYLWEDDKPSWLGPDGQVVWHERDDDFYYGVFWEGMPDLNLRNEAVTAELEDVARFWLADVGVDGFRLDAAKHLIEDGPDAQTNTPETRAWLAGFKAAADAARPDAMLIGEVWDPPSIAGAYVPDSLDLTFDFGLAGAYRLAVQNERAAPLRTAIGDSAAWPTNQAGSFLTNHDQTRIMTELRGDPAAAKLAAFLLLTGPGTPFLYYGEEIGMTGTKPDERIRTPMRWTPDPSTAGFTSGTPWEALSEDDAATVNVDAQTADTSSLLTAYRDLIRVRNGQEALRNGSTTMLDADVEPVAAWLRTTADSTVLVIANLSDEPVAGYSLSLADGPLCGPVVGTLLGTVGGDPGALVSPPQLSAEGGVSGWTPIAELAPRSGYLVELSAAP